MKSYRFKALLQNSGWLENAVVNVDARGKIVSVSSADEAGEEITETAETIETIRAYAIPAFQNAHSHAFQYAMAGLTENHRGDDDFWSWRDAMYRLALALSPDEIKTISAMLYRELVRQGYSNVAEFHYVHHDPDGKPYDNLAEIGAALVEAAAETGIKITLIPIFYQKGGFGTAPNERQKRFISRDFENYARLYEASAEVCRRKTDIANTAVGIHSLRGVEAADIIRAANELPQNVPFHIHIAEQLKEVEDCLAFTGKRPVEWLLENCAVDDRFNLVHATHLTDEEIENLADRQANVVICPSTEGNLGDGIFPLRQFQTFGGRWSIGTDSHIGLNPFEEIRLLDYGQRLVSHKRNTFGENAGLYAFKQATIAGRCAMNNYETEFFAPGADFDACLIDENAPLLENVGMENLASTILFTADSSNICGTFVKGKLIRKDDEYARIKEKFVECVKKFR